MAIIERDAGDYFGAQESALQAREFLNENDSSHFPYITANYNTLGATSRSLEDYDQALLFFEETVKFSLDSANRKIALNNIALAHRNLENYGKADSIYQQILADQSISNKERARVLSNQANARWESDSSYFAVPQLLDALRIRLKEKDVRGQNASYAHLSDYYKSTKPDSALFYAQKQYQTAIKIKSPDAQVKALRRLIDSGCKDSVQYYFQTYAKLSDSLDNARSAAKNQFALIRYEVEKNKADNLRLQNDNTEKESRLFRQRVMTGSLTCLMLLFVGGGSFWYKKRKERLELEAAAKIKASKLETSKKVHDVVANGIYYVMSQIEYNPNMDKEQLLDSLDDMYNKSRNISHEAEEDEEVSTPDYHNALADKLKSFAKENRRVLLAGNEPSIWSHVGNNAKNEIREVLIELMVNMSKHSLAENVVVRFERDEKKLLIHYQDDGIGMAEHSKKGKGMENTVSRIKGIGGAITFVQEPGKGVKVTIQVPVAV
ncbi:ATP-binding protein [Sphingobacterium corticis]|uniref:histidine kinase n=1 Tax=Sphingobacterium corticis TaxID=1812823 RepID=A0ABW5NIZ5_9SPHI